MTWYVIEESGVYEMRFPLLYTLFQAGWPLIHFDWLLQPVAL